MGRILWAAVFVVTFVWSAIEPKDTFTWFLEVLPALIGAAILLFTYQRFKLTSLLYFFILIHCIILMVGGHYTYAEVPLFDNLFGAARNNYDKLGHFAQGFVPALIARELLLRLNIVNGKAWMNLFALSVCLAFSAFYELIEWWVAVVTGENAEAFLGTQGYVWDTQSDMAFALFGAITCLILMAKWHDRQLKALKG
ncbi:DUF2238 domain-containing protein [Vibrio litoralis]|uniref:DUF2238 domain-containing protein n=1 Tax=Vibrio litoralis TaxID=335972 RepID=UPI001868A638|nr:DUF2238 domain-containing protein [Vibrio litoralis]